jgi:16S rRNA (uracil1498-N3)-methyltransferase
MGSLPLFLVEAARLDSDPIRLDGAEGRHASTVRRLRPGEPLVLSDGVGRVAVCTVTAADRSSLLCAVERRYDQPRPAPRLVVVQALPKGERAELAVSALTEVGVDELVPWAAARCVTRWSADRAAKGLARWRATAREASKQSRRVWLPEITAVASTAEVAARLPQADLAVVLHEAATQPLASLRVPDHGEVVVVVGPEGGIDDAELGQFAAAGAVPVRMGPTVLRTSTAGTAAAAVLLSRTPRWNRVSEP